MPAATDPIPLLYEDFGHLLKYLDEQLQPSFSSFVDAHFRKTLVLSVARLCLTDQKFGAR
jgi:hypothetical protein